MKAKDVTEKLIDSLILANAAKHDAKSPYWISGEDFGETYCVDCVDAYAEQLRQKEPDEEHYVAGGYVGESDSLEQCFTCGCPLDSCITTYGCVSELDHFEENGFDLDDPSDCYSMERIMGSCGFCDDELTPRIKKVIAKAVTLRDRKAKRATTT